MSDGLPSRGAHRGRRRQCDRPQSRTLPLSNAWARKHFIELQQSWLRLATQIEYDRAMLELIEGLGEERPPTSRPRSNWSGVGFGRRPFMPTRRREL
jgi:hypothetical protein